MTLNEAIFTLVSILDENFSMCSKLLKLSSSLRFFILIKLSLSSRDLTRTFSFHQMNPIVKTTKTVTGKPMDTERGILGRESLASNFEAYATASS